MTRVAAIVISPEPGLPWWQRARQGAAIAGSIDGSGVIHGRYDRADEAGSHTVVLQDGGVTCPGGTTAIPGTRPAARPGRARQARRPKTWACGRRHPGYRRSGLTGDQVVTVGSAKRELEDLA